MQTEVYVTKYPIAKNFRFCNTDAKSLLAHRRKDLLFWILEFGTERAYIFLILDRIGVVQYVSVTNVTAALLTPASTPSAWL